MILIMMVRGRKSFALLIASCLLLLVRNGGLLKLQLSRSLIILNKARKKLRTPLNALIVKLVILTLVGKMTN